MLTNAITGGWANKLKPSLVAVGLDPDNLQVKPRKKFDLEYAKDQPKAWKDIWSAGHGVGQVKARESTAEIIATLKREYAEAVARELADPWVSRFGATKAAADDLLPPFLKVIAQPICIVDGKGAGSNNIGEWPAKADVRGLSMSNLARVSRRTVLGGMAVGSGFVLTGRSPALAQTTKLIFIEPFDIALEYIHEMNAAVGGHFKVQGLDIDIPNARGTSIAIQQVVAKQAAFSRVGALDLMKASASQNVPLVSIATSLQEAIFSLISLKSAPINTPADMKGKTIGVASMGGGQENTLDLLLSSAGIAKADVPRQAIGSNVGNVELLKQGRVNGFFATVENTIALTRAGEPVDRSGAPAKFAPMPGGAIIIRRAISQPKNPDRRRQVRTGDAEFRGRAPELPIPNMILDRIEKKYEISSNKDRGFRIEASRPTTP